MCVCVGIMYTEAKNKKKSQKEICVIKKIRNTFTVAGVSYFISGPYPANTHTRVYLSCVYAIRYNRWR
jgi:hypothetical protein